MARRYTEEQREWLLLHFSGMTNHELARAYEEEFGEPTLPYVVHNPDYGWSDGYPTVPPVAYYSYDPAEGYGPEGRPRWHKGHPNYRKENG